MANLYSLLRDSENVEGAKFVLISSLDDQFDKSCEECKDLPDFLDTVYDKTFRAASGRLLIYYTNSGYC